MKAINPKNWTRNDYIEFYTGTWGCPCIPVAITKMPSIKWAQFQEAMPTKADYDKWFKASWGIAIIMKNGLFSIDVDTDELFKKLRGDGAFPPGSCIYKSAHGYHVIMRASIQGKEFPYTVPEHNDALIAIDPDFDELGIGGVRHLANVPDTPERLWLPGCLFEQPVVVDYEEWLESAIGWSHRKPGVARSTEGDQHIFCPLHDDKATGTPSLIINHERNSAHCFGCHWQGNIWQLEKEIKRRGAAMPPEVVKALEALGGPMQADAGVITRKSWGNMIGQGRQPDLIENFLPSGENAKLLIVGPEKIGKTELMNTIADCAAQGIDVLGRLHMPRPLRTAIGNFEQVGDDLTEQINDMAVLYGLPPADMLFKLDLEGRKLNNPNDAKYLKEQLMQEPKIELLLLDSMYMSVDSWNDETMARTVTRILGDIVKSIGCAVILSSHSKADGGGGFGGGGRQQEVVSMLGWHLKRWCGSMLVYSDMPEAQNRYYGKLEGTVRGGIGFVSYGVAYSSITHAVSIIGWDDMPMNDGLEAHAIRKQDRVLKVQQLVIAAQQLGYRQADIARALGVDPQSVTEWVKGQKAPGEDNWLKVDSLMTTLSKTGELPGSTPKTTKRAHKVQAEAGLKKDVRLKAADAADKNKAIDKKQGKKLATEIEPPPPGPDYRFNDIV